MKITTRLLRTGVHIIAPKRPRALRIWPITTWMPMKKMVGRQYRARATVVSARAGFSIIGWAISWTSRGAPSTARKTTPARPTITRVSSRLA